MRKAALVLTCCGSPNSPLQASEATCRAQVLDLQRLPLLEDGIKVGLLEDQERGTLDQPIRTWVWSGFLVAAGVREVNVEVCAVLAVGHRVGISVRAEGQGVSISSAFYFRFVSRSSAASRL